MEEGIKNVTCQVLPFMWFVAVAVVDPDGPVPAVAGCRVTVTLAAGMLLPGKLDPVTLMTVMPGCPALGEVGESSLTAPAARGDANPNKGRLRRKIVKKFFRLRIMPGPSALI